MRNIVIIAGLLAALPGCTRIANNEGFIADEQLLASVQPGVDNKASVQKALGRPTIIPSFDQNSWYYISRLQKQTAFLRPKPTSQNVLIVRFDAAGNVSKVERRGLERVADITPDGDKTPVPGRRSSLLQDLFGNIGAFGAPGAGGPGADGPR